MRVALCEHDEVGLQFIEQRKLPRMPVLSADTTVCLDDEILGKAATETSPEKRKALYSEFQKIVVDDVPIFFINAVPFHNAFAKGLGKLPESIWGVLSPLDEIHWVTPPKT